MLSKALFIAVALVLFVLNSAYRESSAITAAMRLQRVYSPFYDVLVRLEPQQAPLSQAELHTPRFQRRIYDFSEVAQSLWVSGSIGVVELLGLQPESRFFTFNSQQLEGRRPESPGEVALPSNLAQALGFSLGDPLPLFILSGNSPGALQLTIVGIYEPSGVYNPLLGHLDELRTISGLPYPNVQLMNHLREGVQLEHLVEWLGDAYPGAVLQSALYSQQLALQMQHGALAQGGQLSFFLFLFLGISLYTIAVMTFLERRREYATLKAVGVTGSQLGKQIIGESSCAYLLGIAIGSASLGILRLQLSWIAELTTWSLLQLLTIAASISVLIISCSFLFPLLTVRVASVSQLLFSRVIPLRRYAQNSMGYKAYPEIVYREHRDNLRFLLLPRDEGDREVLYFKNLGEDVRQGEVVAQEQEYGGYGITEWEAPCDGTVVELLENGQMGIRPHDPLAPFHQYPSDLLVRGRALAERFGELQTETTSVATLVRPREHFYEASAFDIQVASKRLWALALTALLPVIVLVAIYLLTNVAVTDIYPVRHPL